MGRPRTKRKPGRPRTGRDKVVFFRVSTREARVLKRTTQRLRTRYPDRYPSDAEVYRQLLQLACFAMAAT